MTVPVRHDQKQNKSLSDVFNQFAKDSADRFPVLKGKLLIFDNNEKTTYARESLDLKKAGYTPALIEAFIKKRKEDKNIQTYAEWNNNLNLDFILYDEPVNSNERDNISGKTERDIYFILDHELGHLVIKDPSLAGENEQYKDTIKESIADAYALIRHYQRYGTQSKHRNATIDPWARAGALILNKDTTHFSSFMLDEIIKRKDIIDFSKLSPHQTAELAKRFAVEYTPPSSVVNRTARKLKPVKAAYLASRNSDEWLKVLAKITLDHKTDPYTFKLCAKILRGYLEGRTDMDGRSVTTTGADWDSIRKSLHEAEQKHAQEDILFNIPVVKSAARKRPSI
jgi:hypothetical protein